MVTPTLFFTTKNNDTSAIIYLTLPRPETFDVLLLAEHIQTGQRIEQFSLDYFNEANQVWQKITSGTTVGYKRLLRFNAVTTKKVRLVIQSSRLNPTLAELGLYKMAM